MLLIDKVSKQNPMFSADLLQFDSTLEEFFGTIKENLIYLYDKVINDFLYAVQEQSKKYYNSDTSKLLMNEAIFIRDNNIHKYRTIIPDKGNIKLRLFEVDKFDKLMIHDTLSVHFSPASESNMIFLSYFIGSTNKKYTDNQLIQIMCHIILSYMDAYIASSAKLPMSSSRYSLYTNSIKKDARSLVISSQTEADSRFIYLYYKTFFGILRDFIGNKYSFTEFDHIYPVLVLSVELPKLLESIWNLHDSVSDTKVADICNKIYTKLQQV